MKIMARDQGLDSFPASACAVKSLPLQIVLFGRVPCKDFPPFPGISQVTPPPAHQVPLMRNKVPAVPRVWPNRSLVNIVRQPLVSPCMVRCGAGAELM